MFFNQSNFTEIRKYVLGLKDLLRIVLNLIFILMSFLERGLLPTSKSAISFSELIIDILTILRCRMLIDQIFMIENSVVYVWAV